MAAHHAATTALLAYCCADHASTFDVLPHFTQECCKSASPIGCVQLADFLTADIAPWAALYWLHSSHADRSGKTGQHSCLENAKREMQPELQLQLHGLPPGAVSQVANCHPIVLSSRSLDRKLQALPEVKALQVAAIQSEMISSVAPDSNVLPAGSPPYDRDVLEDTLSLSLHSFHCSGNGTRLQTVATCLPDLQHLCEVEIQISLEHMAASREFRTFAIQSLTRLSSAIRSVGKVTAGDASQASAATPAVAQEISVISSIFSIAAHVTSVPLRWLQCVCLSRLLQLCSHVESVMPSAFQRRVHRPTSSSAMPAVQLSLVCTAGEASSLRQDVRCASAVVFLSGVLRFNPTAHSSLSANMCQGIGSLRQSHSHVC